MKAKVNKVYTSGTILVALDKLLHTTATFHGVGIEGYELCEIIKRINASAFRTSYTFITISIEFHARYYAKTQCWMLKFIKA